MVPYSPAERAAVAALDTSAEEPPLRYAVCSVLSFFWPTRYIFKGIRVVLGPDTCPGLPSVHRGLSTVDRAQRHWDNQVVKWHRAGKPEDRKPKLASTSRYMLGWWFHVGVALGVVQGGVASFVRALVLRAMLQGLQSIVAGEPIYSDMAMGLLIVAFTGVVFLEGWLKSLATQLLAAESGTNWLSWIIPLIQRKTADASDAKPQLARAEDKEAGGGGKKTKDKKSKPRRSAGTSNEANLVGNDCLGTFEMLRWGATLPQAISGLVAGTVALFVILGGAPTGICVGWFVLTTVFNNIVGAYGARVSRKELEASDARLKIMREIIDSIGPVKFMCWEDAYFKLISEKRAVECNYQIKFRLLMLLNITSGKGCPAIAAGLVMAYMGSYPEYYALDAATVFSALAALNSLRMPLITLPFQIVQ